MEFKDEMNVSLEKFTSELSELKELFTEKCDAIMNNISSFKVHVANELIKLKNAAEDAEERICVAEEGIAGNLQKIEKQAETLKSTEATLLKQINKLKNELASQTDRGMRSTLTFRGIIESQNNENYQKTPKVLANLLSKIDTSVNGRNKMSYSEILDTIDRAHRSKPSDELEPVNNGDATNNKTPRPIHVKFVTWRDSEYFKSIVIKYNKSLLSKGKNPTVFVDNMFSEHTNARRKEAWNKHKELKNEGLEAPMFIRYPATLMVKNPNTGKYFEHSIF